MFPIEQLILLGSVLVLFAVLSSKFSARLGVPVLVLFIGLGMLAGSEGLGGIAFDNHALANGIGTVALALILFDGGLRTSTQALKRVWKPSFTLATLGVLATSAVVGVAASWVLGIPLLEGMLLGSIVGSTDAAAVFSVMRGSGGGLPDRLSATLEVESGSNDPMAIFLTVGILGVLMGQIPPGLPVLYLFVQQVSIGTVAGVLVGVVGREANNRIALDAAGLYPVMMAAVGFLAFGIAGSLGGSGFLAVYVAGILLGNGRIVFKRGIFLFSDGMAWLAQIVMFTVLGLLVFPSRLMGVASEGLTIAAILILVARPIAVLAILSFFRFTLREMVLVAWGGLRGAVPIILATYPLLIGLPSGQLLFDVVFFVVLVSAVTQGWSLPYVARRLGLEQPPAVEPPVTLDITSLRHVDGDIVEYLVVGGSAVEGRSVRQLALPDGAVVAMITRGTAIIPPRGSTRLRDGDHAFLVLRPGVRSLVDRVFSAGTSSSRTPFSHSSIEFPLSAHTTVSNLADFYGITVDAPPDCTLETLVRRELPEGELQQGTIVEAGGVRLRILECGDGHVDVVGLQLPE